LATQILVECPHPNLLPPGEGTSSPISLPLGETDTPVPVRARNGLLGEGWVRVSGFYNDF
jgi:hypothetical protein